MKLCAVAEHRRFSTISSYPGNAHEEGCTLYKSTIDVHGLQNGQDPIGGTSIQYERPGLTSLQQRIQCAATSKRSLPEEGDYRFEMLQRDAWNAVSRI